MNDKKGRRIGYNWWRDLIVSSWSVADTVWHDEKESFAMGYETEEQEFSEKKPRPTLKQFMIGLKHKGE